MKENDRMKDNANIGFFIIDYSTGGGVERVTADLMSGFLKKGFRNLYLISLNPKFEKPVMSYPDEVLPAKIVGDKKDFASNLESFLKEKNIQHLIFQGDNVGISLEILMAAKRAGTKAYPQYHGSPFAYLKKYADAERSNFDKKIFAALQFPLKKNQLKKYIESSPSGIFCVSEGSADELKQLFPKLKHKIFVKRNPVIFNEKTISAKDKTVFFLSRMERRHKNAFLAVKSWALIHERFPDWTLKIAGDGSLLEKMKNFCEIHNIKNVVFEGFVKNPVRELEKSAIAVSTSNCEGFPMAIAEAITCGCAIAATDSDGGIKDMLIAGKTALISPKNDEKSLTENISVLIENQDLREELSKAAIENLKKIAEAEAADEWISELFG